MNQTTNNVLLDKPYFTLRVEIENTPYAIDINGVTIIRDMEEGASVQIEIPVNHWMRSGKNDISLMLASFPEKPISVEAEAKIILQVKPSGHPRAETREISRIVYNGKLKDSGIGPTAGSTTTGRYDSNHDFYASDDGDVSVSDVVKKITTENDEEYLQTITLRTPFPEWAFFRSDDILEANVIETMPEEEYQKFLQGPFEIYKKIADNLSRKDVVAVMKMFEERNREYDQAYFSEPGTKEKELSLSLTKVLNRPNTELIDVKNKSFFMTFIHSNKKLLKLERSGSTDAIVFRLKDLQAVQSYEILLRREKGQWIITR